MLDRPGTSSGVQVMARKVNGGPIALAHVSSLLSLARAYQYDLICNDKVHLERVGGVFRCLCDCTGHFHSCKCASCDCTTCPLAHSVFAFRQIIVQPQLFSTLAAISWVQCLYYEGKRSAIVCTSILLVYLALFAGWEVGITYAIRVGHLSVASVVKPQVASQRVHSDSRGHLNIGFPAGRYRLAWQLFTYAHVTDSHVHSDKQGMMVYGNHQPFLDFCGIASGVLICAGLMYVPARVRGYGPSINQFDLLQTSICRNLQTKTSYRHFYDFHCHRHYRRRLLAAFSHLQREV